MTMNALTNYSKPQDRFSNAKKEQNFEEKVVAFRKEIRQQKLVASEEVTNKKQVPERQDSVRIFTCGDPELFNAWDSSASAEDALKTLDENLSRIGEFSLHSKIKPEEALEHFASQYSIYKQHIQGSGDSEAVKRLEALMEKHVEKYAKSFGEIVGGFFEDNGVKDERKWMYESVKERVGLLTEGYDQFISKNAAMFGEVLDASAQNGKSAAFSLRAAYKEAGDGEIFFIDRKGGYMREELSAAAELVKTADKIMKSGTAQEADEEELGVRLGKLALNALAFLETSKAKGIHKQGFMNAINTHIDSLIEESDALVTGVREDRQDAKAYPPLDRGAVRFVIDSMVNNFKETKSFDQAVRYGEEQGLLVYLAKKEKMADVTRYQQSSFWEDVARDIRKDQLIFEQLV